MIHIEKYSVLLDENISTTSNIWKRCMNANDGICIPILLCSNSSSVVAACEFLTKNKKEKHILSNIWLWIDWVVSNKQWRITYLIFMNNHVRKIRLAGNKEVNHTFDLTHISKNTIHHCKDNGRDMLHLRHNGCMLHTNRTLLVEPSLL